jgi:hypothetical protein
VSSSVTDSDKGYRKLMASLAEASKGIVATVGIHAEEGGAGDGSSSVIQVAEWAEFGTSRQPARPFVSSWADERGDKALAEIRDAIGEAVHRGSSPAIAVDRLAQKFAGEIQSRIADGIPPPNAPSTVAQKGSSTPLINTGQLRAAIRGKLEGK